MVMYPNTPLEEVLRISETQKKALSKLKLRTIHELLHHFPVRYGDTATITAIGSIKAGDMVAVYGRIDNLKTKKTFRGKIPTAEGTLSDETGDIKLLWFHQAYLAKMLSDGMFIRVEGKVSEKDGVKSIMNPKVEKLEKIPIAVGNSLFGKDEHEGVLYPVYPETKGITSNWIYHSIQKLFSKNILDSFIDPIPSEILSRYNLPNLKTALIWIHSPRKHSDALAARKRFAFEEIFFIQLERALIRNERESHGSYQINKKISDFNEFISRFPFPLTGAQKRAVSSMLKDLGRNFPMSRLLEGDVGSGKTAVAAIIAYAVATARPHGQTFGNLQVAYMAPTEILAQQHFESFINYFQGSGMSIGLITGSGCRKFPSKVNPKGWTDISRTQLKKWVANGEIPMLIGTHALIQKSVTFKDLGLVIIDEQHRFGTEQRRKLREKESRIPHLLSMTATPIPRTLALTLYGDLDLSLLDELPAGRKTVSTSIVRPDKRKEAYEFMRGELKNGRQAFIICPRIDEPDPDKESALLVKSVKEESKRLQEEVFPEFEIAMLHGKMPPKEKDRVMKSFTNAEVDILVATSVVEVGVNVPNATIIVIEGAERFGLAQLHQLRGRVMRSSHKPHCFIFTDSQSKNSNERLGALTKAANGFELAEYDLQQRGAGQLGGGKQWGLSDLGMEAIQNIKMVEAARTEARTIIDIDPELEKYPFLHQRMKTLSKNIHFE
jgi:ATP-dependent DNA helicase RecG